MVAAAKFLGQSLDFWANVKFISQKIGYTDRRTSKIKIPSFESIVDLYNRFHFDTTKIIESNKPTPFSQLLLEYFAYRAYFLNEKVAPNLMTKDQAEALYLKLFETLKPSCPIPFNKQSGDKKTPAYFTGITNMLIEASLNGYPCDYNPKEIPIFTINDFPVRSLSRRVDGCFPFVTNPVAVWEIKEYYYTTTFGSRIADGIYETLLDGYELAATRNFLGKEIYHYLMVDDYRTWWIQGKSYLCRICDLLHMGLLTEALFGKEIVDRIPAITPLWLEKFE